MSLNFHLEKEFQSACKRSFKTADGDEVRQVLYATKTAVLNWSKNNNMGCFFHFLYRIGQAVLYIFGKSDWQVAKKSISKFVIKKLDLALGLTFPLFNISTPEECKNTINKTSEKCLEILLKINNQTFDTRLCLELTKDILAIGIDIIQSGSNCGAKIATDLGFSPSAIKDFAEQELSKNNTWQGLLDKGVIFLKKRKIDLPGLTVTNRNTMAVIGNYIDSTVDAVAPALSSLDIDAEEVTKIALKYLQNQWGISFKA